MACGGIAVEMFKPIEPGLLHLRDQSAVQDLSTLGRRRLGFRSCFLGGEAPDTTLEARASAPRLLRWVGNPCVLLLKSARIVDRLARTNQAFFQQNEA